MIDFSAAERRLTAALERLDRSVETAARRMAQRPGAMAEAADPPTLRDAATPQPSQPSAEIAALHDRQAATLEAMQIRLAEAHERLADAGDSAAGLAAANEALALANRELIEQLRGAGAGADAAIRAALDAEIESLRAARAAEVAQMGEILDALDRMLGVTTAPRSHSTGGRMAARRNPAGRDRDGRPARGPQPPRDDAQPAAVRELTVIRDEDMPPGDDLLSPADGPVQRRGGGSDADADIPTPDEERD